MSDERSFSVSSAQHSTNVEVDLDEQNLLHNNDAVVLDIWRSMALAMMYILTGTIFFLLVHHSKTLEKQGLLKYDSTSLVMMTEVTKIFVCLILYYVESNKFLVCNLIFAENKKDLWRLSFVYMIPAFLYAANNNLLYLNLSYFDPVTVQMFMQTRILFTGFLFMFFLKRFLSLRQWTALIILTIALFIKYTSLDIMKVININILFVFLQSFISSLAGVYNEVVFKRDARVSIHTQNFFLYIYCVLFNFFFGIIVAPQEYIKFNFIVNFHFICFLLIITSAANGLIAALILKYVNVMVKTFASAVETIFMVFVTAAVFGGQVTLCDLIAAFLVTFSVVMYYTKGIGSVEVAKLK